MPCWGWIIFWSAFTWISILNPSFLVFFISRYNENIGSGYSNLEMPFNQLPCAIAASRLATRSSLEGWLLINPPPLPNLAFRV
jgi:hypothetical protein